MSTAFERADPMFLDAEIEIIHPDLPRGRFRSVLFDFDGTLSLIREGWPQVMIPMMVEVLGQTGTGETEAQLTSAVEEFVMRLNGRQTIYQMMQLAEEVSRRGGQPLDPLAYKHRYHDLLMQRITGRLDDLRAGRLPAVLAETVDDRRLSVLATSAARLRGSDPLLAILARVDALVPRRTEQ